MVDKDRNGSADRTYYVDPTRNWDAFDHVRTYHVFQGAWILEFEDFDNGGDRDFNDLVVQFTYLNPEVNPAGVPRYPFIMPPGRVRPPRPGRDKPRNKCECVCKCGRNRRCGCGR